MVTVTDTQQTTILHIHFSNVLISTDITMTKDAKRKWHFSSRSLFASRTSDNKILTVQDDSGSPDNDHSKHLHPPRIDKEEGDGPRVVSKRRTQNIEQLSNAGTRATDG